MNGLIGCPRRWLAFMNGEINRLKVTSCFGVSLCVSVRVKDAKGEIHSRPCDLMMPRDA